MRRPLWIVLSAGLLAACAGGTAQRVLAPEQFGLTCVTATVCVDDTAQAQRAIALRREAVAFVETRFDPFKKQPRVLFCASRACFAQFGDPKVQGQTLGTSGVVINANGWNKFNVRHELIHHWQFETFGLARTAQLPPWYLEGMSYALSGEPRRPLPNARIEGYRRQFEAWQAAGNNWRVPPR